MTLTQLKYVLAVAEYQNFTLAAENTFVTQPTLSMQIQKLEAELEIEIFDRSGHPIKITPIGEVVIEQAKKILHEAKRMKSIVGEEKDILQGTFVLGVIPTVIPTLVPLFYKNFINEHPKVNLIIKELETSEIIKKLNDDSIDFGIAATPISEDGIEETPLYYEPMMAYVPANHSLHKKQKLSETDLNPEDLLLLKDGHCFRNNVLSLCAQQQLENVNIKIESGSFETLVKLADEGLGITILPSLEAEDLPEEKKKNLRPFSAPEPNREISLIYHSSQVRIRFKEELKKSIKGVLRGKLFMENQGKITFPMITIR